MTSGDRIARGDACSHTACKALAFIDQRLGELTTAFVTPEAQRAASEKLAAANRLYHFPKINNHYVKVRHDGITLYRFLTKGLSKYLRQGSRSIDLWKEGSAILDPAYLLKIGYPRRDGSKESDTESVATESSTSEAEAPNPKKRASSEDPLQPASPMSGAKQSFAGVIIQPPRRVTKVVPSAPKDSNHSRFFNCSNPYNNPRCYREQAVLKSARKLPGLNVKACSSCYYYQAHMRGKGLCANPSESPDCLLRVANSQTRALCRSCIDLQQSQPSDGTKIIFEEPIDDIAHNAGNSQSQIESTLQPSATQRSLAESSHLPNAQLAHDLLSSISPTVEGPQHSPITASQSVSLKRSRDQQSYSQDALTAPIASAYSMQLPPMEKSAKLPKLSPSADPAVDLDDSTRRYLSKNESTNNALPHPNSGYATKDVSRAVHSKTRTGPEASRSRRDELHIGTVQQTANTTPTPIAPQSSALPNKPTSISASNRDKSIATSTMPSATGASTSSSIRPSPYDSTMQQLRRAVVHPLQARHCDYDLDINYAEVREDLKEMRRAIYAIWSKLFDIMGADKNDTVQFVMYPGPALARFYRLAFSQATPGRELMIQELNMVPAFHALLGLFGAFLFEHIFVCQPAWASESGTYQLGIARIQDLYKDVAEEMGIPWSVMASRLAWKEAHQQAFHEDVLGRHSSKLVAELFTVLGDHIWLIPRSKAILPADYDAVKQGLQSIVHDALILRCKLDASSAQHEYLWYSFGDKFNGEKMSDMYPPTKLGSKVAFTVMPGINRVEKSKRSPYADIHAHVMVQVNRSVNTPVVKPGELKQHRRYRSL